MDFEFLTEGESAVLVLATHNQGKVVEMSAYLKDLPVRLSLASEFGCAEPEETGTTFTENALIKARAVCAETGHAALADDSGLCIAGLDGAPGVHSARWAGPDKNFARAMGLVHQNLNDDGVPPPWEACFMSVLALVLPDGTEMVFEGRCDGQIVWPPRGLGGFGYDPIFAPQGDVRTFGEMVPEEKKRFSHRAKAVVKFAESYRALLTGRHAA